MALMYCWHLFFVTKDCSKNNALLSSVIPRAESLTILLTFTENFEEASNVCKTSTKNIGEACERRFYNKNNNLNLIEKKLLLV